MDNKSEGIFFMSIGKVMSVSGKSYRDVLTDNISRAAVKLNMMSYGLSHDDAESIVYSKEWDSFNEWRKKGN